jgi:prepilin-type N-terminal cleavage/methylation domain-containing protein
MNTHPSPVLRVPTARAFSLIEVLVAVLVLSLGLLGLGAVFPMVVRQQRIATETNLGISARNGVEQMLFSLSAEVPVAARIVAIERGDQKVVVHFEPEDLPHYLQSGARVILSNTNCDPNIDGRHTVLSNTVSSITIAVSVSVKQPGNNGLARGVDPVVVDAFSPAGGPGWRAVRDRILQEQSQSEYGDWLSMPLEDRDADRLNSYVLDYATADGLARSEILVPLAQRLYPMPYTTDQEPRFVWDMVARITDKRNPDTSPLMVAIFLRPIDPGIRPSIDPNTGVRYSVLSTLIDPGVSTRDRRNPISVDRQGRPTQDGRRDRSAAYAKPIVAEAGPGPGIGGGAVSPGKEIQLLRVLEPSMKLRDIQTILYHAGQVFLDGQGVLREIKSIAIEPIGGGSVKITFIDDLTPELEDVNGDGNIDGDDYNPIVFLPQTSYVEPIVFTVNP